MPTFIRPPFFADEDDVKDNVEPMEEDLAVSNLLDKHEICSPPTTNSSSTITAAATSTTSATTTTTQMETMSLEEDDLQSAFLSQSELEPKPKPEPEPEPEPTSKSKMDLEKQKLAELNKKLKSYQHTIWGNIRSLSFSIDGNYLVTTEDASMLRVFSTDRYLIDKADRQVTNEYIEDPLAVACHKSFFVCSSLTNVVMFSLPFGNFMKLITRHSLPVRALAVSPDGKHVASGSDDCRIRWCDADNPENMVEFLHHTTPIAYLCVDPLNTILLSTSVDGKLCIWDIKTRKLFHSFDISRKVKEIKTTDTPIARWSHTGKYIAINGTGNEIIIIRRNQKTIYAKLLEHKSPVSNLDWSNLDPYLVSISLDKVLLIWNIDTKSIIFQHSFRSTPMHVRWQPYSSDLVVTFNRYIMDAIRLPSLQSFQKDALHQIMEEPLFPSSSEEEEEEDSSGSEAMSELDDFIVDDDAGDKSRKEIKEELSAQLRQAGFVETTPMQPAFQPGATPTTSEKYYLAFNIHGLIYAVQQDIATSYHIERHDRLRYKPIQFTEAREFTLAALSHVAAVFACAPEKDLLGSLYTRILDPFSTQSDWTIPLRMHETPLGVAAGDVVVLATDTLVRVYSLGGMPLHMVSFEGIYLSMVAQAHLCVWLTHVSAPFQGRQQLAFTVLDMKSGQTLHQGRVPISANALVTWLGISDTGMPLVLDSVGNLRGFAWDLCHWCPLLSTQSLGSDPALHYFGVGMVDAQFLCLVSKAKYPGFPRPAISEYPCGFPLQDPLEKQYLHLRLFKPKAINSSEKCLLQLLQMACENELHQKALDLVRLLSTPSAFSKAIQIALFYHLHTLAEKIQKIGEEKQSEPVPESEVRVITPPQIPAPKAPSPSPSSSSSSSNTTTPLFPDPIPTSRPPDTSKRSSTSEPTNLPKKPKFNPFLKKTFNPFRETPPTASIQHSVEKKNLKQSSMSQFVTPPGKDEGGK